MATSCSICGETLQSEGAAGLHELVAHVNPRARPGAGRLVVIVALGAVAAVLSGALVAFVVGRGGGSSAPAEEVAASADGVLRASARPGFRTVSKPDQGFSIDLPEG